MIIAQTIFVKKPMANKFPKVGIIVRRFLRIGYVLVVLAIAWAYYFRPQDAGFIKQEITLLHLFALAFPLSLFVDFWILAPLIALDYFLGGFLSSATSGRIFNHYFVFLLGGVNAVIGYYQWFTVVPRLMKKAKGFRPTS